MYKTKDSRFDVSLQQYQPESHPSTAQSIKQPAVYVTDAYKSYGIKRNPLLVLDGLNMTVPKGTIYGLLGASGCGKTTLLSCILGQRKLNSGKIWILGAPPGTKSSGVPGPRVGYMPQETALYGDFTIHETLVYFGWIAGMENDRLKERSQMLIRLFLLPSSDQRVKNLSGGQQRRLSLASVLLYEPEVLILDEPTVGADPLLRESMWNHLLNICKEENTTIIMTTHYIEEARQAQMVGLMRKGKLLAEEPPEVLLARLELQSLEEAFLKLSILQNTTRNRSASISQTATDISLVPETVSSSTNKLLQGSTNSIPENVSLTDTIFTYLPNIKATRMKALLWKNTLWYRRNIMMVVLTIIASFATIAFFCICVGPDLHDLSIAVVNQEMNNSDDCTSVLTCNDTQLSCRYLQQLKKHSVILTYYDTEDDAKESVLHGETYACVIIKHNYSAAIKVRLINEGNVNSWNIRAGNIDVFQDASNIIIANYLKIRMYDTYQSFIRDYIHTCDINEKVVEIPLQWKDPVYGVQYPSFGDFVIPGALLTTIFLMGVMVAGVAILVEKQEANFERTLVMGIDELELLFSHVVCEFVIIIVLSIIVVITAFAIFHSTQNGSIVLITLLTILIGFSGMCYGLFISCFCESIIAVSMVTSGTFFPVMLLSGMIWPIEGMHHYFKPFINFLPLTAPMDGMRSISQRNWDLSTESVYNGFFVAIIWAIIFLILSMICIKFKKN